MRVHTRTLAASAALIVMVIAALLFGETFNTIRSLPIKICASVIAAVFIVLLVLTAVSFFASGYFFLRMVNSPQSGQTVFDARMLKGKSLFSDLYLSEEGKLARSRLLKSLRCFAIFWIGGVCAGLLAGWLVRVG
ncbi:hypothetical protein AB3X91_04410 [Paraburkholderia sp. BR14263]|uniref:DUF3899 domain-containing protein n=1 Tax=Paraburkholderia guartelaensis TaxID=2546446 RepID=A0ABU9S596_9BURK